MSTSPISRDDEPIAIRCEESVEKVLDWLRVIFAFGDVGLDEAPAFWIFAEVIFRTSIALFRRPCNTEDAGRVDLSSRTLLSIDSQWSLDRRNTDLITLWNGVNESSLVSMCTTVRKAFEYQRVKLSEESAEPAQAATDLIPKNSNVSTMALMLLSPVARVITHSNHVALVPDGVPTRPTIEMDLSKQSIRVKGQISNRRRSNQVAENN